MNSYTTKFGVATWRRAHGKFMLYVDQYDLAIALYEDRTGELIVFDSPERRAKYVVTTSTATNYEWDTASRLVELGLIDPVEVLAIE